MDFIECVIDWCHRNQINMNNLTLTSMGSDNRHGNGEGMYFTEFDDCKNDRYVVFCEWEEKNNWIVWED